MHLRLTDAGYLVLDRILDGEDLPAWLIDESERCREGCRLAGAGGSGDNDHPERCLQRPAKDGFAALRQPNPVEGD